MELHPEDVPPPHRAGIRQPIIRNGADIGRFAGLTVIRVIEIDVRARRDASKQRRIFRGLNLVPARMRNLYPKRLRETQHATGQQTQASVFAHLLADFEQRLHPDANPKQRNATLLPHP